MANALTTTSKPITKRCARTSIATLNCLASEERKEDPYLFFPRRRTTDKHMPMVGVAFIGCGRAGRIQYEAIRSVSGACLEPLVVHDVRRDAARWFEERGAAFAGSVDEVLKDGRVHIVVVCTPTADHHATVKRALEHDKHVFVEKPLASSREDAEELYALASRRGRLLFTGYNRRYDPAINDLKSRVASCALGRPLYCVIVCRDFPFPPKEYLQTCGGIVRDCVVHDLDYVGGLFDAEVTDVDARVEASQHNSCVRLTLSNGVLVTMVHSRYADSYDQRIMVFCERGLLSVDNPTHHEPQSFGERYRASYTLQMRALIQRVMDLETSPNVDAAAALALEELVCACEHSAAARARVSLSTPQSPSVEGTSSSSVSFSSLRAHERAPDRVRELYRIARARQTAAHVERMRAKYMPSTDVVMGIWDVLETLGRFVDVSDPDVCVPNHHHAYQTAERLRRMGAPEWMQLVGLIHDCGKIIHLRGDDADGTSMETQWSIVGDTFIVDHPLPSSLVFAEFNDVGCDASAYEPGCGLDACRVAYGHDEYLYQVLRAQSSLPTEALYVVRYHSLYVWHTEGEYADLETSHDRAMKGWVRYFNTADLYSKEEPPLTEDEMRTLRQTHYERIVDKFLPTPIRW